MVTWPLVLTPTQALLGLPTIDAAFPNTSEMVKDIHAKGLAAGTGGLAGCRRAGIPRGAREARPCQTSRSF